MTRLLIADDDPIIIAGLKTLLRDSGYEITNEIHQSEAVQAAVTEIQPDILILDVAMPAKNGVEIHAELRAAGDKTPVVLVTCNISEEDALKAIEAGVEGLVLKHTAPDQLVTCLNEVSQGRRWIDRGLLQRALGKALERKEKAAFLASLSPREQEIVKLLAEGLSSSETATRLGISRSTVKVHLHNVYGKLGLANRADLMQLIRDSGMAR